MMTSNRTGNGEGQINWFIAKNENNKNSSEIPTNVIDILSCRIIAGKHRQKANIISFICQMLNKWLKEEKEEEEEEEEEEKDSQL